MGSGLHTKNLKSFGFTKNFFIMDSYCAHRVCKVCLTKGFLILNKILRNNTLFIQKSSIQIPKERFEFCEPTWLRDNLVT